MMNWNDPVGTTHQLTSTSTVTIIDPFEEYVNALKTCFDFEAMQEFVKRREFSLLFDGMYGAAGPFARRVLIQELGLPEVRTTLKASKQEQARGSCTGAFLCSLLSHT
jgi:phosphoglucomutase